MHPNDRADRFFALTNPGGFATSQQYPSRGPTGVGPLLHGTGQGVIGPADGVIQCGGTGSISPIGLSLVPVGQGAAGATFTMQVLAWNSIIATVAQQHLWVPVARAAFNVTLNGPTGVAGAILDANVIFAGTIAQTFGPTIPAGMGGNAQDWCVFSPGAGLVGEIDLRVFGSAYIEVLFALGAGCTGANCLYRKR
jgi:hypothetical protein